VGCTGRYAEAYEFAGHLCKESYLAGVDNSGGAGNLFLTDTSTPGIDFKTKGVDPTEGQLLYNTTQGTNGPVTAVTANTITATGVTWDDGDAYIIATLDAQQRASIELNLDLAANDIHVALAASGACDCSLSTYGAQFLRRLNIIIAAAFYSCSCGKPQQASAENRDRWMEWAQTQLDMLRDQRLEVCAGATGADFPAIATAEQAWNEFAAAKIILNDMLRNQ
jgi:hypothetical protein